MLRVWLPEQRLQYTHSFQHMRPDRQACPLLFQIARDSCLLKVCDLCLPGVREILEADALVEEKRPARVRRCVAKGLGVLQTLLGQSNTVHRSQINPGCPNRPDTEGGLVSMPIPSSLVAWHACEAACLRSPCRFWVRLTVMVRALCWSISASYSRDPGAAKFCTRV